MMLLHNLRIALGGEGYDTPANMAFERQWKSGDCIEATFPMSLHLEVTPDNPQIPSASRDASAAAVASPRWK